MARQTILLVEDDSGVRQALGRALLAENYLVISVASGKEALREFRNQQVDVALLDLSLEEECGWEVFQQLRDLRPRLSIIVMSGHPQLLLHARAVAATALMEKPLDLPVLFQTLDQLTAGSRGGSAE